MPLRYYRAGLNPAPAPPQLKFGDYLNREVLPPLPAAFGHYTTIPAAGWGMLDNDRIGDCAIAGPMHAEMLWNAEARHKVSFTDADALSMYSAITGYQPNQRETDRGADMVQVAGYWKSTGMVDAAGNRHRIAAYMQLDASDLQRVYRAAYLFGCCGIGIKISQASELQFLYNQPWDGANTPVEAYHYVPITGRDAAGYIHCVTWGRDHRMTEAWLRESIVEAVAYVSSEMLTSDRTLEGFNLAALLADLDKLG